MMNRGKQRMGLEKAQERRPDRWKLHVLVVFESEKNVIKKAVREITEFVS